MNPGATFDRVYRALKERIARGEIGPGQPLEPAALGRELASSITPVRDALHRLVGERIIEAPGHNGFRLPLPTEAELRDLYEWRLALLKLVLRNQPHAARLAAHNRGMPAAPRSASELFRELGRRSGSPELEAALANSHERLAPARVLEAALFDDLDAEEARLVAAFDEPEVPRLRGLLVAYHRRRQRMVGAMVSLMRRPAHDAGGDP